MGRNQDMQTLQQIRPSTENLMNENFKYIYRMMLRFDGQLVNDCNSWWFKIPPLGARMMYERCVPLLSKFALITRNYEL
jgi:hypothetical protein